DDLTREAVSEICGEPPEVDVGIADHIRRYFALRGSLMPEQNVKQAWMIPSAETLANPMGTAPGWFVRHDGRVIVIMPGVPREMVRMWREQAVPSLLPSLAGQSIVSRTLKTLGIGESAAEREIIEIVRRGAPTVATYAKDDGVHIRITAIAADRSTAELAVATAEKEIRERIGRYVYGYLDDPIEEVILRAAADRGYRVAIWEAGNAGRLSVLLEECGLSDDVIVEARTTSYKHAIDVTGADDEPAAVASACVAGPMTRDAASLGVAVAVDIQPGESADRSRGQIAIALSSESGVRVREATVSAVPHEIRRRATLSALDFLWTSLRDETIRPPD
ncbi:MAG: molybdopterin-binding protein, partial [Vicinamibacterales bacterium]